MTVIIFLGAKSIGRQIMITASIRPSRLFAAIVLLSALVGARAGHRPPMCSDAWRPMSAVARCRRSARDARTARTPARIGPACTTSARWKSARANIIITDLPRLCNLNGITTTQRRWVSLRSTQSHRARHARACRGHRRLKFRSIWATLAGQKCWPKLAVTSRLANEQLLILQRANSRRRRSRGGMGTGQE